MSITGWPLPKAFALGVLVTALPSAAGAQVTSYAFVPTSGANVATVVDTRTGTPIGTVSVGGSPQGAAPLPDGSRVYIANLGSGTVTPIDVSTRVAGAPITVGASPLGMASLPNGRKVYVPNINGGTVSVIDTTTNTVVATIPAGPQPAAVAPSPDGQRVYVTLNGAAAGASVAVVETLNDTVVGTLPGGPGAGSLAVSPDGTRLFVSNFNANTWTITDIASATIIASGPTGANPAGVAISPDGTQVATSNYVGDTITRLSVATNSAIGTIPAGNGPHGVSYLPDGQRLYVLNYDASTVTVVDVATGALLPSIAIGPAPYSLTPFITPPILTTTCGGCGALTIAGDGDLTPIGVRSYLVFDTGVLQLTGPWTTARHLSLLAGGGTIDTQAFDATVTGTIVNSGTLTKTGSGRLTLAAIATHTGGTVVQQGTLLLDTTHTAPITLQGGTLWGTGTVGTLNATNGVIAPGTGGPGILTAGTATLGAGTTLQIQVNGSNPGTGYDRLAAGTATIANATLAVQVTSPPAAGTVLTILTNATGTFAGLPEGATILGAGASFRITYQAGSGSDVALVTDLAPSIAPPADRTFFTGALPTALAFTVNDDLTAASALVVTATSSNTALLPNASIQLGGSGTARTITPLFAAGVTGSTTVTLTVSDGIQTSQATFTLTVTLPTYHFGEGATGPFFSTDLLFANPSNGAVPVTITYFKDDATTVVQTLTLPATSRRTVRVDDVAGMEATAFATTVVSTGGVPIVVERTMWWDATGYGAHTEKASLALATDWYFAEGSQGFFSTYFLLQNPAATANVAHVTYYLDGGAPVTRDYPLAARSRLTIDAGSDSALVNRSFGARVRFDQPGTAERAMYFGASPLFGGGHAAAGVLAPSTTWLLAEGATGSFFDTFVLMANPGGTAATITATYLPATGAPIVKTHTIPAGQRLTINLAFEDPALASAAVSVQIASTQPVVVERAQYWPHGGWYEAHDSAGETAPALRWGLAEGRVGGADQAQTYILIANPGTQAASVGVTFLRESGVPLVKTFTVAAQSRFNIAVTGPGSNVPELADETFGAVIAATQPVLVERSIYTNAGGVVWAAGTNATGTPLP